VTKLGKDFGTNPVCVGPFQFASRPSADQIELEKSSTYFGKNDVKVDKLTFKVITQPEVRAQNLRSGDVDVATGLPPTVVDSLNGAANVKVEQVPTMAFVALAVNVSNAAGARDPSTFKTLNTPLAQHPELRKAFALALSRDDINKAVFGGQYTPDCSPIPTTSPYKADVTCDKQDLAEAKKLVAQSGVTTPIPVKLTIYSGDSQALKLATVIQSMVKDAGFNLTVEPADATAAIAAVQAGKFDLFLANSDGNLDPDQNITRFYDPGSPTNFTGANYKDLSALLDQARASSDQAKRKQLYTQIVQKLLDYSNFIYLYHPQKAIGYKSSVAGVQQLADGLVRFKAASIG
jgi:peptide/nickel transport system substrate-binding protein